MGGERAARDPVEGGEREPLAAADGGLEDRVVVAPAGPCTGVDKDADDAKVDQRGAALERPVCFDRRAGLLGTLAEVAHPTVDRNVQIGKARDRQIGHTRGDAVERPFIDGEK